MAEIDPRVHRLFINLEDCGFTVYEPVRSGSLTYEVVSPNGDTLKLRCARMSDNAWRGLLDQLRHELGWTPSMAVEKRAEERWDQLEAERARRRMIDPNWDPGLYRSLLQQARDQVARNRMTFHPEVIDDKTAFQLIIRHQIASEVRGIEDGVAADISALNSNQAFVKQRKKSEPRAAALGQAMWRGEWLLTHQGVALAEDGYILDGQHRLEAVVRSGAPAALLVVRNVPDETFAVIDTGKPRTTGDVLGMMGIKNPNPAAAALRLLHYYDNYPDKNQWYSVAVSNEQIHQDLLNRYQTFGFSVEFAARVCQSPNMKVSRSATAVAHYLALRAWPDAPIDDFWQPVRDGHGPYRGHPGIALRNWALGWDTRPPSAKAQKKGRQPREHLVTVLRCWNAFCQEEPLMRVNYDERWAAPKPYRPKGGS